MRGKNIKIILLLVLLFLIVVLLINPKGNFPLNDDWVYAHNVNELLNNNQLHFYVWTGPILLFQTLYGFFITKISGFSFNILRLSTLFFALLSLITFYFLSLKIKKDKLLIFLGALTLFFNPIFINTSFTFLTDIPFLFFYFLALYFIIKGVKSQKYNFLIFGLLSGIASFFIRQNGILFFASIVLIYLISFTKKSVINKKFLKNSLLLTGIAVLICVVGYLLFQNSVDIGGAQTHLIENSILNHALLWLFYSIQYLGLFALPISILYIFKKKFYKKINLYTFLIIFILLLIITFQFKLFFPYNQNIINDYGLGPNTEVMQGVPPLIFSNIFKIIISIIACFGGAIIINALKTAFNDIKNSFLLKFIFINFILQLILILFFKGFDRYFLLLLPMILILILAKIKINKFLYYSVPIILLLILSFFSITLNKNYLDWNRARNSLYQQISQTKFYHQIEGGYELNGWYTYDIMQNSPVVVDLTKPWYLHRLFSPNTNEYVISFSILHNYKILDEREYYNYFLFKKVKIYLLQKIYN